MTWVRLDDTITTHPKVAQLSEEDFAAFISALCYCNQHLTDGVLPEKAVKNVRFLTKTRVKNLLRVGLFCIETVDGEERLMIHDYADYQPTKADVQAEKDAAKERQRRWRERHRNGVSNSVSNGVTNRTHPNPSQEVPPNPLKGGTEHLRPRDEKRRTEAQERRAGAITACRRLEREYARDGKPANVVREWLEQEYNHDPSIVLEAVPHLYKETA